MAFGTAENNNTKEITIPKNEIKKDGATEYLNTLLEERNNKPLSNMDQELKDKITEGNFNKTQKIKHIPEMQKWYNEEGNLTKIQNEKNLLMNELPTKEELKKEKQEMISTFKIITKQIEENLKTLGTLKITDENYYTLINKNRSLKTKQKKLKKQIEK